MKAILLNGPPRSGKDTIGKLLEEALPTSSTVKFAQPIIDFMQSTFGVSCADGVDKSTPCEALNWKSRRQVAIDYSEKFMKPTFGEDIFGRLSSDFLSEAQRIQEFDVAIFTDSGFLPEASSVIKFTGITNCVQVKVYRPGYDFNGDSRSYWHGNGLNAIDFHNDMESLGELFNVVRSDLLPEIKQCLSL